MQKTRTGLRLANVQELFKLDTGAQFNVLPKAAYDKITTKPLQSSSAKLESYTKTCIKPVGKCCLVGRVGKSIVTSFVVAVNNKQIDRLYDSFIVKHNQWCYTCRMQIS